MRQVVRYLEGEVGMTEAVAPPMEEFDGSKGGGGESEDSDDSYEKSGYFDKLRLRSLGCERDVDVDIEAGR